MATWQLQEAKAKFSELIGKARSEGPQIITSRGVETAVVLQIDEWRNLQSPSNEDLLQVLQSGPQFDLNLPSRGRHKHRKPVVF